MPIWNQNGVYDGLRSTPVTSGLVLYLDAANTSSYSGSGTTWTNLSSNTNNGTLVGTPTFSNGSFTFNGSTQYSNHGDVLDLGTSDLTVNVWVRPTANVTGTAYTTFSKALAGTQNYRFAGYIFNNKITAFMQGNGGADIQPAGTTNISINSWIMLTYVFTRSSSISMYINANPETLSGTATISQWNGLDFQSSNPFRIGSYTAADNSSIYSPFAGNISVSQVYFRSLSGAEISQNFNAFRGRYGI